MFVPFSPRIIAHALEHAKREQSGNWEYSDEAYKKRGYILNGDRAERPKPMPPMQFKPPILKR